MTKHQFRTTILFAFIAILFPVSVFAQNNPLFIRQKLIDGNTGEAIPYAHVIHLQRHVGTITNTEGDFKIHYQSTSDSIIFSFVGYTTDTVSIRELLGQKTFSLYPKTELLGEVVVFANNDYLYKLVSDCKSERAKTVKTAKTYLELESFIGERQIEQIECYYNGNFNGVDVEQLDLKNGRVGIQSIKGQYFVSIESSKALYMNKLFEKDDYFPVAPTELSFRQMQKQFDLQLEHRYKDQNSYNIYVISFLPKADSNTLFSGKIWVNQDLHQLVKVNLSVEATQLHPFLPLHPDDSILQVDLNLTKTFQNIDDKAYIESVTFDYRLNYLNAKHQLLPVKTHAVLYAYDYATNFTLPFFAFEKGLNDYRKISAVPYNTFFWEAVVDFNLNASKQNIEQFLNAPSTLFNSELFQKNRAMNKGLFEHPFMQWKKERITFAATPESLKPNTLTPTIKADQYALKVNLYADINSNQDSLHYITAAVFDPYQSFYHLPMTNAASAFINMYFDLYEINRRQLTVALHQTKDTTEALEICARFQEKADQLAHDFMREVDRGTNMKAMLKWNDYIRNSLDIDNIDYFQLLSEK